MRKISLPGQTWIWFGAAVSIAEILTGTLLSPLGFGKAAAAILLGHLVGCALLYCAGVIGAQYGVTAMEGVKRSFGSGGGIIFALLNLIQLAGWSSVMIFSGSQSANGLLNFAPWVWPCIIGALIALWIMLKTSELKILNTVAVSLLFALSLVLGRIVFRSGTPSGLPVSSLGFSGALELSIAMPLSWLPLIGDYTCGSERPKTVSLLAAGVYFLISCWMYFIGLGAALFAGSSDVALIFARAGLGIPALLIVVLSTVTTTYLDVYSAEMSMASITKKIPPRATGFGVCLCGVLFALCGTAAAFEQFLYWIGSVFAPMIAIQITDFFILKNGDARFCRFRFSGLAVWFLGFLLYRLFLAWEPVCGSTLPAMAVTGALHWGCQKLRRLSCRG